MSKSQRKIGFYFLKLKDKLDNDLFYRPSEITHVIKYIESLGNSERIHDILSTNKIHLLEKIEKEKEKIYKLIFVSAKYHHRPPLINKETAEERENPKKLSEGEQEKTHAAIKFLDDELILIMEDRRAGISISAICNYLTKFAKKYYKDINGDLPYKIEHSIVPKEGFLSELEKLSRARLGDIYVNKQLLGSEALDFSNRTEEIQEHITISVKSKKNRNIKDLCKDLYHKIGSEKTKINKLRVYGVSKEGNQIILDTDIIKKIQYVDVGLDSGTGIVNSDDVFYSFIAILDGI